MVKNSVCAEQKNKLIFFSNLQNRSIDKITIYVILLR